MNMLGVEAVYAVVVTYLPQAQPLTALLRILVPQVEHVIVVDNTPNDDMRVKDLIHSLSLPHIELIRLGENLGIAKAINVGCERSMEGGAKHILISDQDSLPAPDMVVGLLRAARELSGQGFRIGAIGPGFLDEISLQPYRFQVQSPRDLFYGNQEPTLGKPHVQTLSLISSGTLIPVENLSAIGFMREDFFIDHVDVEWCHRAIRAGYALFGTRYARMSHHMGDRPLRVWALGWRNISQYAPLRLYYRFRNFTCMCRMRNIPSLWKLRASLFWLQEAYGHLVFSDRRLASLRMIARGISDGLRGRLGKYSDNQSTCGSP